MKSAAASIRALAAPSLAKTPRATAPAQRSIAEQSTVSTALALGRPLPGAVVLQRACACASGAPPCRCHEDDDLPKVPTIQTRLAISEPGDEYEREADRTTDLIIGSARPSGNAADVRMVSPALAIRPYVHGRQRAPRGDAPIASGVSLEERLSRAASGGAPIAPAARAPLESRFGVDFRDVRVHNGAAAASLNDDLDALAFTHGRDIYFARGQYDPASTAGQRLLAHELTHVVQQAGGHEASAVQRAPRVSPPVEQKLYYGLLKGKAVHEGVESRLLAVPENEALVVEALIPGGTTSNRFDIASKENFEIVGRADMYTSADSLKHTVIGVRGLHETDELLKKDPKDMARKYVDVRSGLTRVRGGRRSWQPSGSGGKVRGAFPTWFKVGDLKPLAATKAGEGHAQLGNYIGGLHDFAEQAKQDGATTGPANGDVLTDLHIPSGLDFNTIRQDPTDPGGPGPGSFIVGNRRYWVAEGRDSGLYFYFDLAHPAPGRAAIEHQQRTLTSFEPVRRGLGFREPGPDKTLGLKRRPGAENRSPVIQRSPDTSRPKRDWDAEGKQWEEQRAKWDKDIAKPFLKSADGKALAERIEAEKFLKDSASTGVPTLDAKGFHSIELWSGLTGKVLGALRFKFGGTIDKLVAFYDKIREKFKRLHGRMKGVESTGVKVGWQRKLIGLLLQALKIGFVELLKTMYAFFATCVQGLLDKVVQKFTEDISEELQGYVEKLHAKVEEYTNKFKEEFESRFGRWDEFLDDLSDLSKWVQIASDLVTLIRFGVQAISCLSPPLLGCLWGLAVQLAVEEGLTLVAGTAWFDRHIVRPTIRNLIRRFAGPAFQNLLDDVLELAGLTEFASDVAACHQADDLADRVMGSIPEQGLDGAALIDHRNKWYEDHKQSIQDAQAKAAKKNAPTDPILEKEKEKAQHAIRKDLDWPEQKASDDMWKAFWSMRNDIADAKGRSISSGELSVLADNAAKDGMSVARAQHVVESVPRGPDGKRDLDEVKKILATQHVAPPPAPEAPPDMPKAKKPGKPFLSVTKWYYLPPSGGVNIDIGPQTFDPPPGQPEKDPTVLPGIKGSF